MKILFLKQIKSNIKEGIISRELQKSLGECR